MYAKSFKVKLRIDQKESFVGACPHWLSLKEPTQRDRVAGSGLALVRLEAFRLALGLKPAGPEVLVLLGCLMLKSEHMSSLIFSGHFLI